MAKTSVAKMPVATTQRFERFVELAEDHDEDGFDDLDDPDGLLREPAARNGNGHRPGVAELLDDEELDLLGDLGGDFGIDGDDRARASGGSGR
jgi:hypothetical protein